MAEVIHDVAHISNQLEEKLRALPQSYDKSYSNMLNIIYMFKHYTMNSCVEI